MAETARSRTLFSTTTEDTVAKTFEFSAKLNPVLWNSTFQLKIVCGPGIGLSIWAASRLHQIRRIYRTALLGGSQQPRCTRASPVQDTQRCCLQPLCSAVSACLMMDSAPPTRSYVGTRASVSHPSGTCSCRPYTRPVAELLRSSCRRSCQTPGI